MAAPGSDQCQQDLDQALSLCQSLGVPIADGKTDGPSTSITYLGFELDTIALELRLPEEKLLQLRQRLTFWRQRRSATKREVLSLIGSQQHCCQAIVHGRPFLRCLIDRASSVEQLYHFVNLSPWEQDDISWWGGLLST